MKRKKKMDTLRTRPPWCFDKKCKVILSRYTKKGYDEGASSFCYGVLPEQHSFLYRKTWHHNNLCHCYYTPLKGAIRFLTCEEDIWGEIHAMIGVLNRRIKTVCMKCLRKTYRVLLIRCDFCGSERRKKARRRK